MTKMFTLFYPVSSHFFFFRRMDKRQVARHRNLGPTPAGPEADAPLLQRFPLALDNIQKKCHLWRRADIIKVDASVG
jgi:hypothetical protein